MILLTTFASSFVIALSGAMMPGPLLTVTLSESSRRGAMAGPLMIFGHGLLEIVLVAALFSGFAPLLQSNQVFITVALLGGGVLLWMGMSMLRSLPTIELPQAETSGTGQNLVLAGIVLSLCNPYWLIWWVSIGMGYILHSARIGPLGIGAFLSGHLMADLAWYSLISFGVARGRAWFSPKRYRTLIGLCSVILLGFSGYFFASGLGKLI
ncbi:MAG: LysE family transporter [Desulfobulbus sp.]|nr:LysE family transporter [Desulfobulbus sp.]